MTRTFFTPEDMKAFEPAEKIGLVATVSPEGLPHITLITSIMAPGERQLTLGQFSEGLSKEYMKRDPRIAFLVMTLDRRMWRGTARWTHLRKEGPEYRRYNELPMFRYNTYFGINTVHYLDLVGIGGPSPLPLLQIAGSTLLTAAAAGSARTGIRDRILKPFAEQLFNRLDSLKFLSWIGPDGFPVLLPAIQARAADSRRIVFSLTKNGEERKIPAGAPAAVYGLTMQMENVLVRGRFAGPSRYRGVPLGTVDIDWVYNSMIPCHGRIWPEQELKPVTQF